MGAGKLRRQEVLMSPVDGLTSPLRIRLLIGNFHQAQMGSGRAGL